MSLTPNISELNRVAMDLMAPNKGILAADESSGTIAKRFDSIQIESNEQNRLAYREMLFTASGISEYISGVILYDETIRQKASDGQTFVEILQKQGILPGIKVDLGTENFNGSVDEKTTKGLEGLTQRLKDYASLGAKFCKWRAVITIGEGIPTEACVKENAIRLAQYAKDCQEVGLVPIVEPEVLMDGPHTIEKCEEVTTQVLTEVFNQLKLHDVALEGIILKPNMVIPGRLCPVQVGAKEVAEATIRTFMKTVPKEVPGIAFLSGGQSEDQATENLNEMNKIQDLPWQLSFSYGRALQAPALKVWQGKPENIPAAQESFIKRAKFNSLARSGKYSKEMEKGETETLNLSSQD